MRYKKITLHTLRLSVLTMWIHSGAGVSETEVFNGGTYELTAQSYAEGIEARNQAQVNNKPGQALSLSSGGTEKTAVKASGEGTSVMLQGTENQKITVNTEADGDAYGLWAIENATLTLKHMDITLKGANDTAVAVQTEGKVDIGSSTLSGTENQFYGLWATGKNTEVTGHQLKITSQGADSRAVSSYSAQLTLKDSTVSINGKNAWGIVTYESGRVAGHHLDIKAGGQGAKDISANNNSTVDIQNSTLSSIGDNARGIIAFNSARVTGHHLAIMAEGQGASAIYPTHNSTIHLHDSHIQTLATLSAIFASDEDATDTTVSITGGSLHAAGDLILSAGGKTNLVFSRVVISPPGSGHAIHFTGTGGEVDLTLNQTALSGNIVAEGENKARVTLDSGSTWSFKENATVTALTHAGKVVFDPLMTARRLLASRQTITRAMPGKSCFTPAWKATIRRRIN
ncbi:hypothetical protein [Candidatus Williamhamiltonella defendens]|uniref:hypothetical protein n=1 Tax=Candidatus Williamhamiltonella defendens TaxID=138072 RepID=UPI00073FE877|nr:hypothetical protein [Candidatus Hamiltonella defensa]